MPSITLSRGELYEQYKKSDPKLAEKFLGENTGLGFGIVGMSFLGVAIMASIIIISITGSDGFGPTPLNPHFYSEMFAITGGVNGPIALIGIIMLAIGYYKRRNNLAEKLTATQINGIAGKPLIDSRPERL